jgi:hypothetical protein
VEKQVEKAKAGVEKRREPTPAGHFIVENPLKPYQMLGKGILGALYLVVKLAKSRTICLSRKRQKRLDFRDTFGYGGAAGKG